MSNEEDKEFLKAQREDGRRGSMAEKDMTLEFKKKRREVLLEQEMRRAVKAQRHKEIVSETVEFESASSSSTSSPRESSPQDSSAGPSLP